MGLPDFSGAQVYKGLTIPDRSSNSIKVVCRFRPQNRTEIDLGGQPIVEFESEDTLKLDVG